MFDVYDKEIIPRGWERALAMRWASLAEAEGHSKGLPEFTGRTDYSSWHSSRCDRELVTEWLSRFDYQSRFRMVNAICSKTGRPRERIQCAIRELIKAGVIDENYGKVPRTDGPGYTYDAKVLRLIKIEG